MFLEGRAIARTRVGMITRNVTLFFNLTVAVRISASQLGMSIISTEQTAEDHVALAGWVALMVTPVTLVIGPLWFDRLGVSSCYWTFFNYPSWQDVCF